MKKVIFMVSAVGMMGLLSACQSTGTKAAATPEWVGIYAGTIPCADCEGIETQLTLNADSTYALSSLYIDHDSVPQVEEGKFAWCDNGNIAFLRDGKPDLVKQFKVEKDAILWLDDEGNTITGELAANYVLARVQQ
jgi:uncharacterized lipoprotein NlpE involved in copper resistance